MQFLSSDMAVNRAWGLRLLLCLAALYTIVMSAWIGDDAQITFRQIWNFIHGDGMTYNVGERVQAFTHPAWFLLLSGAMAATRELFVTTLAISMALSLAAIALLLAAEWRASHGHRLPLLTPAWLLLFSVAFCDYTTSGLENPLSYFLTGLLLWTLASPAGPGGKGKERRWAFLLLAALAVVLGGMRGDQGRFPFLTTRDFHKGPKDFLLGVSDERGYYYQRLGLVSAARMQRLDRIRPGVGSLDENGWPAMQLQPDEPPTRYRRQRFWLHAVFTPATRDYMIEDIGLTNPFVARLPAVRDPDWRIGHPIRRIPTDFGAFAIGRVATRPYPAAPANRSPLDGEPHQASAGQGWLGWSA